ncbi:hypothetical protein CLV98_103391 [Dyadobacter jejuensis]|uniref:Uncharacterized protein n=1 Tax=Dyadobacter jejuensis TaxID=1082580 RepID=A0A316ANI1_9BACT|nr:hypothetical protein [Dyadobacter jejuensis]PWJ59018.1 hypothetical protein CLV98_103391 [Dyadobacter jejuensis]
MKKQTYLAALVLGTGILLANIAMAQSQVDSGISTHNYKHPNKAAKAKVNQATTVNVATFKTIERYGKAGANKSAVSSTPKYAPQPKALVVLRSYEPTKLLLNPLQSDGHYKTQISNQKSNDTSIADSNDAAHSYPNVD